MGLFAVSRSAGKEVITMNQQKRYWLQVNIALCKMYIVQRISESIAENLRRNPMWPTNDYIQVCQAVMTIKRIPEEVQREIIAQAVHDGYESYLQYKITGLYCYHNGSGQHPELLVGESLELLRCMLEQLQSGTA
jgi:hypothetical protein